MVINFLFWLMFIFFVVTTVGDLINLPVVYYAYNQLTASAETINWLQLKPCSAGTANNANMQITIIQPSNPTFVQDNQLCYAVVEVSSCADSFDAECIIATNYVKSSNAFSYLSNNITIPYNASIDVLSIRYQAYVSDCAITVHITYVSEEVPINNGIFYDEVFGTFAVPSNDPTTFLQYVQSDAVATVKNLNFNSYYLSFCESDINGPYTVDIIVTSDPNTPLGAFDLIACSKDYIPDNSDCTYVNKNEVGVKTSQRAASITMVSFDTSEVTLNSGMYVNVEGIGGEPSLTNDYLLSIVASPNST